MPEVGDLTQEGAAEGRSDNWGEVVTRQPYRKVRLDHLLSKETEEVRSCITVQLSRSECRRGCGRADSRVYSDRCEDTDDSIGRLDSMSKIRSICEQRKDCTNGLQGSTKIFRWRCAQGTHPFSSRTRWLRPKRPMVLCWRRYGRAGGCRNPLKK